MEGRHDGSRARILLITDDEHLRYEVSRLAVSTTATLDTAASLLEAQQRWGEATVVLVGGDCVALVSAGGFPQRRDVLVVHAGSAPPEVFRAAFDLGAVRVIELPSAEEWLPSVLAQAGGSARSEGVVVGFVSAAGGSGASTLAVATACLGVARATTVLVDLDPTGVGIERLAGYDGSAVTTWATLGGRSLSPYALRDSLPVVDGVHLVGFGLDSVTSPSPVGAAAVVDACRRAFGLTVIDLPRAPDGGNRAVIERCDLLVVVSRQSIGASLAGGRLLASLPTTRAMAVTRAGPRTVDAADLAAALQIPLLIDVADQRGLDEVLAAGAGPLRSRGVGLRRAATAVLDQLKLAA